MYRGFAIRAVNYFRNHLTKLRLIYQTMLGRLQ